jgi:hypothetical protein
MTQNMITSNIATDTDTDKHVNFSEFCLPIPDLIYKLSYEKQMIIFEYFKTMDDKNKKAYLIAINHLGTSFNICKSNGYKEWKKKN